MELWKKKKRSYLYVLVKGSGVGNEGKRLELCADFQALTH
jgi:hypothetical protein